MASGLVLLAVGGVGSFYAWRTTTAQMAYRELKFGESASLPPEEKTQAAEMAHAIYSHNYYLSMLLAEGFWTGRLDDRGRVIPGRVQAAAHWCQRGVAQNPYRRELRWIEAHLAALESPAAGLAIWRGYVERAFWDAWNIAGLIGFLADAGNIEEATLLLPLLQGRPERAGAAAAVNRAWQKELHRDLP